MGRNIRDGLAIKPMVFPEKTGVTIPKAPVCGCAKYGTGLWIIRKLKVSPRAGGVGALKPFPACTERYTEAM